MSKNRKVIIITLFVALWIILGAGYMVINLSKVNNAVIEDIKKVEKGVLPSVDNEEKLLKLLKESSGGQLYPNYTESISGTTALDQKSSTPSSSNYSTTNVQVEGVDEADLVKTDGKYIYSISDGKLVISEVYPTDNMQIKVKLFNEETNTYYPNEMILSGNYLAVICYQNYVYYPMVTSGFAAESMPYYGNNKTTVLVFDISNKDDVKKVKTFEMDGSYLSSRLKDNSLYIISNKYVYYYSTTATQDILPKYSVDGVEKTIGYDAIYYFPDTKSSTYTNIGVVDLSNLSNDINVTSYLSSSQTVYMSLDNLYIAANTSTYDATNFSYIYKPNTSIYKFNAKSNTVTFVAKHELEGTLLNQFSMDENNGYFRVTLTNNTDNSLYILDSNMNVTGNISGIANGEKIYSTRFIGDRAYVVTFKTVDPLFVIDLKNPSNPKILGELKIPGYSSYLHPYDENHIIGIGQDTAEIVDKDQAGNIINTRYVINGMKMAIFDVTDVSNPKQQFSKKIGDKYTYSDVLYNHKAFLFSKEKNLLAFPIQTYGQVVAFDATLDTSTDTTTSGTSSSSISSYVSSYYQGYIVYNIDLTNGFTEKGKITHYSSDKVKNYYYDYMSNIERGLFIDNILYTVSDNQIKANDLTTLKEIKTLELK